MHIDDMEHLAVFEYNTLYENSSTHSSFCPQKVFSHALLSFFALVATQMQSQPQTECGEFDVIVYYKFIINRFFEVTQARLFL